jgi:thioredoxin 1
MTYRADYAAVEPARTAVDAMEGAVVLEFGAPWCGHCQVAQPLLRDWLAEAKDVTHVKVEDAKGRPLGRSFRITLWPTVIVLEDGRERTRAVRPTRASDLDELREALDA